MKKTYVLPQLFVESVEVEQGIANSIVDTPFVGDDGWNVEAGDYGEEVVW